jgi:hypothetical protein
MACTIITRTINSATQNAITINNSAFLRPLVLPSNWSKIRLGMRLHFNATVSYNTLSAVTLAFGLSSGTTNQFSDSTTNNFAGVIFGGSASTWTLSALYSTSGEYDGVSIQPATKVGSTVTTGSALTPNNTLAAGAYANANDLIVYLLDITKGSPNYSFYMPLYCYHPVSNLYTNGISAAQFLRYMQQQTPAPPPSGANVMVTNSPGSYTVALAVREATYPLNSINVSWNGLTGFPEICDLAVGVMS